MRGRVYLVGAGCGGADLITVRGQALIKRCEVLIYDDLIDESLLYLAPPDAELISVGKRGGRCSAKQDDINFLIIEKAREGKTVVRLKGGDPYVFGRGGEEAMALMEAGIAFSVVPGISSGIAVPMEYGIPVTHRGIARSLTFITGHTRESENPLPEDMDVIARIKGTLCFYMGISHLKEITDGLMENGKPADTPVAIVSGGNSNNPSCIRGKLSEIAKIAKEKGAQSPSIILVGKVAALDLLDISALPLTGVRIGLTGTDSFCERLRALIWERGGQPVQIQKATCVQTDTEIPWNEITDESQKVLVFLSANGVRTFFERMAKNSIDIRSIWSAKIAVIGKATGDLLKKYGVICNLMPSVYTKEALTELLKAEVSDNSRESVYIFDSMQGSEWMADELKNAGIKAKRISIYNTSYSTVGRNAKTDYLVFGSAGAVRALHGDGYILPDGVRVICIGPVARQAFFECYGTEPIVPGEITAESLVECIVSG